MGRFATLVLYERHGHTAIGYRAETMDQIAQGDVAEGTRGAWELRCWTPTGESSVPGISSGELVTLINATSRTISECLGEGHPLDATQRFHCLGGGKVIRLPGNSFLAEHLASWSKSARTNDVFLQTSHLNTEKLHVIGNHLQREIASMVRLKDELAGRSHRAIAPQGPV